MPTFHSEGTEFAWQFREGRTLECSNIVTAVRGIPGTGIARLEVASGCADVPPGKARANDCEGEV